MYDLDGRPITLAPEVLDGFRAKFRGQLMTPDDPGYDEARRIWNGMIDRRPALIARCIGPDDVVEAVRFVSANRLLSSVRGGGHNIAGLAICEGGVVIDLSTMREVAVDPQARTARAQAGCTLADLDRETQRHGLAAVLGFVSTTGIAGLTVGGGFGYLTRQYGWTCDNLVSMDVVTAAGERVRAAHDENPELFFALRGGGGNFGIVTSFEYRLHPVGPEVVAGAIAWQADQAPAVIEFYRHFIATAPRELTCVLLLRYAPPAPWLPSAIHGQPIVLMLVCHSGQLAEGERLVAPIKAFGQPVADTIVRRPYTQMQSLVDGTQPKGRRYYWKSEYLPGLDGDAAAVLLEGAATMPPPHSAIALFHVEGALNELPADHSPAGNRDAELVTVVTGGWDSPADDAANMAWVRATWQALRPFSTGGVYLNFLTDDEGPERTAEAYGADMLERLAALKRQLDPDNLFRHTKTVLPRE
jgi:FAD/FMN-containing dehydrogenase